MKNKSPQPELNFENQGFDSSASQSKADNQAGESNLMPSSQTEQSEDRQAATATKPESLELSPFQQLVDYNFLQYASYVICDRAIPALEDGFKPVQRRIMYALHEKDDGRFIKVANIVGHTMQYHPHGDASINDALVALVNRGYLIEGQGNFGNIYTGDSAAAARYIECRLTPLARAELFNNAITDFVPSYDGRKKEPLLLPVKLPLLLMLGAEGIAVGLSTKILPHNFKELLEAQIAILKNKPFTILPDFPQGGLMDASEYEHGNGRLRLRAVIEERDHGRLAVTELPFGVTTESLISSIEDAARRQKVPVRSITDFTSEKVDIELNLKTDTSPDKAIAALYAFTHCEIPVACRSIVLRENRPFETNSEEILRENTARLLEIVRKELELKKHNLTEEFHAKTLAQIFIENRLYKKIETSKTAEAVNQAILDGLQPYQSQLKREITKADLEMLLALPIRRISFFDINKNRKDIEKILLEIQQLQKSLANLKNYTIRYLENLIKKYGADSRRKTKVTEFTEIKVRELTSRELEIFHDKENNYIGHDVKGDSRLYCSPYDKLILVWDNALYKVITPPDKLFVDKNFIHLDKYDRKRQMLIIYKLDNFTYVKKFAFGGAIMEREYFCAPEGSKILHFTDQPVTEVYVKYAPAKGQRIHQQVFNLEKLNPKGVRARGNQLTAKKISRIAISKPAWWKEEESPAGTFL